MVQKVKDIGDCHQKFADQITTLAVDPLNDFAKNVCEMLQFNRHIIMCFVSDLIAFLIFEFYFQNQKNLDLKVKEGGKATDDLNAAKSAYEKALKGCEKLKFDIEQLQAKLANPAGAQGASLATQLQKLTRQVSICIS